MEASVVAVDYRGADLVAPSRDVRIGVCGRAYHLQSAGLVGHRVDEELPRVVFPVVPPG